MDLKLVSLDGNEAYAIATDTVVIGRDSDSDITITKDLLSRRHAKLSYIDGSWVLEDLGSTNGTCINNRLLKRPTEVKSGDVIKFGEAAYYLKSEAEAERTIVAARLPQKDSYSGGSVVIDDEPDSELTSFQQSYQLPSGWTDTAIRNSKYPKELVDQRIHRAIGTKQIKPEVALVFFFADGRSLVFGVSAKNSDTFWTIGRQENLKIRIDDPSISMLHAKLIHKNGNWWIEDVGATNGIRIDGEACQKAVLQDSQLLSLGRIEMVFRKL
ncbi:MAG: FHA domain-containing protein [Zhongshania sp.]|uniref:FHA domain-containing protein n=1 Tax=Zhongshania sp. TaxID=1971902 RepID=UPI00260E3190|nr:FHA domain-containing protein [Zhongshania sp.]MDF1691082.1 FHA domain-containing protein [Zhongshania sp.]